MQPSLCCQDVNKPLDWVSSNSAHAIDLVGKENYHNHPLPQNSLPFFALDSSSFSITDSSSKWTLLRRSRRSKFLNRPSPGASCSLLLLGATCLTLSLSSSHGSWLGLCCVPWRHGLCNAKNDMYVSAALLNFCAFLT